MHPIAAPHRWPLAAILAALALFVAAPAALAADVDINSSGPLTDIWESDALQCQVVYQGQGGQFYSGQDSPASCTTELRTGGTSYGLLGTHFTPVSQSAVTGSGTNADPYRTVTSADAGSTGLNVTQTDTYIVGQEGYRIDMTVSNSGSSDATAILYHAADCYVAGNDRGYGYVDSAHGAAACAVNLNNDPPGLIQEMYPISAGSHYREGHFSNVYSFLTAGTEFDDTCDCSTYEDNGVGLSWAITVPAGGSVTRSLFVVASPSGVTAPPDATPPATTPAATPQETPVAAPEIKALPPGLRMSHRDVVLRNGKAVVTIRCDAAPQAPCAGNVTLLPTGFASRTAAHVAKAAKATSFNVAAGTSKKLKVAIPSSSQRRVARSRKAVAMAVVQLSTGGGNVLTSKIPITLLQPRH